MRAVVAVALLFWAGAAPVSAKDLGFGELTDAIANATKGTPALIPFVERPTVADVSPNGRVNAFGYLGSVANPSVAYPKGSDGMRYYRASTQDKCNPDDFAFPAGQHGLQKFSHQSYVKVEAKAGELTFKGAQPGDRSFALSAFSARLLRRVKITITDMKEYTLDARTLRERVAQISAAPGCETFKQALTKVYEGKVTATYYFEAGAEASLKADITQQINLSLGLAAVTTVGGSESDPDVLQFDSEPRMFAGVFRPVADVLGRRPPQRSRRAAADN
jgi:hypothetical protein